MDWLSATGLAGIISLSTKVVELATGAKKNAEAIKKLKEETEQNAKDIEKVATAVAALRDRLDQSDRMAAIERREFLTAIKNILLEHGADHKRVADLEEKMKPKKDE